MRVANDIRPPKLNDAKSVFPRQPPSGGFLFHSLPPAPSLSQSCSSSETLTTSFLALLDVALASHAEVVFLCARDKQLVRNWAHSHSGKQ